MNGINLIPPHTLVLRRRRKRIRAWSAATGIYAAVLGGAYGALASGTADATGLDRRIAEIAQTTQAERAELEVMRQKASEAEREADAARMMGNHPDWSVLLGLLAKPLTAEMSLHTCEVARVEKTPAAAAPSPAPPLAAPQTAATTPTAATPRTDAFKVTIAGLARTQAAVTDYVLELERLTAGDQRLFDPPVMIAEAKGRRIGSTDVVAFRIECTLSAAAPKVVRKDHP